jgi:signal transduction histidine kinase
MQMKNIFKILKKDFNLAVLLVRFILTYISLLNFFGCNNISSTIIAFVVSIFLLKLDDKLKVFLEGFSSKRIIPKAFISIVPRLFLSGTLSIIFLYGILSTIYTNEIILEMNMSNVSNFEASIKIVRGHSEILIVKICLLFLLEFFDLSSYLIGLIKTKTLQLESKTISINSIEKELIKSTQQQKNIIDGIQHELGNKIPAIINNFNDLKTFLTNFPKSDYFSTSLKIRDPFPSEPLNSVDTINDVIRKIEQGLNYSILMIENMSSIITTDSASFNPSKGDINEFIKEEVELLLKNNPNISFVINESKVVCNFDTKQFKVLINNIIENAKKHSFTSSDKKYILKVYIKEDNNMINLQFSNNGHPFPKNFSAYQYTKQHTFYGETGNSGIGGYLIGLVVNHHQGKITIFEENIEPEFKTNILITIKKN